MNVDFYIMYNTYTCIAKPAKESQRDSAISGDRANAVQEVQKGVKNLDIKSKKGQYIK